LQPNGLSLFKEKGSYETIRILQNARQSLTY
jgi:hypothetical protein